MAKGKQSSRRAHRRIEVRYGPERPEYIGYSGNVSRSGIMVRTIRVFPPGTFLHLELKFPDGSFQARGEVVWAREGPVQLLSTGRIGMGINFLHPSEEFREYLERVSAPR